MRAAFPPVFWHHEGMKRLLLSLRSIDKYVTFALMGVMALVVLAATVEVIVSIVRQLFTPALGLADVGSLQSVFGSVLLVLIGVELFESLKSYALEHAFRAEIVITVAMVAIARKVIILDVSHMEAPILLGIAAIIAALGVAYFLFTRRPAAAVEMRTLEWWNRQADDVRQELAAGKAASSAGEGEQR